MKIIGKNSIALLCISLTTMVSNSAEPYGKKNKKGQLVSDTILRKQQSDLIANGAKPVLVSKQFSFTEGPAVDKHGNIFFTDQPNDKIWKYDIDGKLSVFMDKTGRSNGLYFDKKGNLVACADEQNQLWSISPQKKLTVLVDGFEGKKLNGPNDLWIDAKGGIYITDPYYQRDYWTRKKPDLDGQKVYYLPKGKKKLILAAEHFVRPNGIVGTPDGRFLYVADIGDDKTYKYDVNADGTLTTRQLFVAKGADGITLDELGNLYLSGNGVTVFNPEGKQLSHIDIPEKWTANVCFGGKNRDLLFMTASQTIYILQMQVKGVE